MRCGFLAALAHTINKVRRTDPDGLDEQRWDTVFAVVKGAQIDEGIPVGVTEQGIDEGCYCPAIWLRESHDTISPRVRRMMDVGAPNFSATLVMKLALG
jgi:hypothetical protein